MIILQKSANMNIKQFLKFKIHAFKHLFRKMNKNVFMRKVINYLIIKTQILKAEDAKFDHKKIYQKIAAKYF